MGIQKGLHHAETLSPASRVYRLHKATGQAVVRLDGRDIYLGKYGSAASREAYQRIVAEWSQNGGRLPDSPHTATVTEVVVAYTEFATGYYRKDGKPTNEVRMIKTAIKIARELYGRTPAAEFGPLALKACRENDDRQGLVPHPHQQTGGPREADVQVGHRKRDDPRYACTRRSAA